MVQEVSIKKSNSTCENRIYNPEQEKVLQYFLAMNHIYKTDFFLLNLNDRQKRIYELN